MQVQVWLKKMGGGASNAELLKGVPRMGEFLAANLTIKSEAV